MDKTVYRAVDANLNRVGEGLRVVEDICRFSLDRGDLQQRIKTLRHELQRAVPANGYERYRRAAEDVGFAAKGEMEYRRRDMTALSKANFKRIQEGLRCLEEFLKLEDTHAALQMKTMRYSVYDLEQEVSQMLEKKALNAGLYLILTEPRDGYEKLTEMAVLGGIPAVQLRYKGDDERRYLELARRMRILTKDSQTLFIVNDRPDIALMVDADGVHLGQDDLPVERVRKLIGTEMLLGLSTHNLDQVNAANSEPVDYIGFGPLFATNSKAKPDPVVGPEMLAAAREAARHPIVAIGGLNLERIGQLPAKAFRNAAVIRAVSQAPDPAAAITAIHQRILEVT